MPEYLAPGVYLEEVDTVPMAIPGVPTSTIDFATAQRLVAAVRPIIGPIGPDWLDFNEADPGITLVQLFAYLAESLLYRTDPGFAERHRAVFLALGELIDGARNCAGERATLRRPHYFAGRLLDAATLQAEQDYHREKARLHNRKLHGVGIVSGLDVQMDVAGNSNGDRLRMEPGYAVDACGNEVAVATCVHLQLPLAGDTVFISLRYWEHPVALTPTAHGNASGMLEEASLLAIVREVTAPAIALARLVRTQDRWQVDPDFVAPRVTK